MPVLRIRCPDCGHEYQSLVMPGARIPRTWTCSVCGNRRAQPQATDAVDTHPLSGGPSCRCCG